MIVSSSTIFVYEEGDASGPISRTRDFERKNCFPYFAKSNLLFSCIRKINSMISIERQSEIPLLEHFQFVRSLLIVHPSEERNQTMELVQSITKTVEKLALHPAFF